MSQITDELFKKIAPMVPKGQRDEFIKWLNLYCPQYSITTELRLNAFFANVMVETQNFTRLAENLNYSAKGLMDTWPGRFPSLVIANQFAHKPREIANKVYNGRMGNRIGTDDGYDYRGGGGLQTTGRDGYQKQGDKIGVDFVAHPELLRTPQYAIWTACAEFQSRGCNQLADQRKIVAIRQAINGGTNGLSDCKANYEKVARWIPDYFVLDTPSEVKHRAIVENVLPDTELPDFVDHPDLVKPPEAEPEQTDPEINSPQIQTDNPKDVLCKERPSTFIRWLVAAKTAVGSLITLIGSYIGFDDVKGILLEKAGNIDAEVLAIIGLALLKTAVIVGAGVLLVYLASKLYDKSANRANGLNMQKLIGAQDRTLQTVDFGS